MSIQPSGDSTHKITLVAIHGLLSSPGTWAAMRQLIESDRDLADVEIKPFRYTSKVAEWRPDRRIPALNDLADRLRTFLDRETTPGQDVVLLSHSQGGLIVQRYLARMVRDGKGEQLARIRQVLMYACPNNGSQFLLSLRRRFMPFNPQEKALRPFDDEIIETHSTLTNQVITAREIGPNQCPVAIAAFAGIEDKIVPPNVAGWVWPVKETVDGDHFSVIRPTDHADGRYRVLRDRLLRVLHGEPEAGKVGKDPRSFTPSLFSVEPPLGRLDSRLRGRDELIASLVAALQDGSMAKRCHVLHGLPGCGKSHIALETARRAGLMNRRVWWVSAEQIEAGMREVASQLGAPASELERTWSGSGSATDLVWRFLNESAEPWLIIIDNADQLDALSPAGKVADGTGWLRPPRTDRGTVLITSREGDGSRWGNWMRLHHVRPLAPEVGALVLLDRTGTAAGNDHAAYALAEELGGLPLALRAAGDYLKSVLESSVWRPDQRIIDFDSYRHALRGRFHPSNDGDPHPWDESLGLARLEEVYDMSLAYLADRGVSHARDLLRVLACFGFAPVPYGLMLDRGVLATSPLFPDLTGGQYAPVLEGLQNLSMIDLFRQGPSDAPFLSHCLDLHPLIRGLVRERVRNDAQAAEYYAVAIRSLWTATGEHSPDNFAEWDVWHRLAPHGIELTQDFLLNPPDQHDRQVVALALEVARRTARYLLATGLTSSANALLKPLVERCATYDFQFDSAEVLKLRHEYARTFLETQPARAEELLREIITDRERALGEQDADTLASRHKLANAIMLQSRWAEAETELRAIVEAEATVRGSEHSDTMIVRHSLARTIVKQNRTAEALRLFEEILEIRLRLWPPDDPETIFVRQSIATAIIEIARKKPERERAALLTDLLGRIDDAIDPLNPTERLWPQTLWLAYSHAQILLDLGRIPAAIGELERLLADRVKVLGPNHPETGRTRDLLQKVTSRLNDPAEGDSSALPLPRQGGSDPKKVIP